MVGPWLRLRACGPAAYGTMHAGDRHTVFPWANSKVGQVRSRWSWGGCLGTRGGQRLLPKRPQDCARGLLQKVSMHRSAERWECLRTGSTASTASDGARGVAQRAQRPQRPQLIRKSCGGEGRMATVVVFEERHYEFENGCQNVWRSRALSESSLLPVTSVPETALLSQPSHP